MKNDIVEREVFLEDHINTMWVWIPRYEYMYTNLGDQYTDGTQLQPGEIKVNFLSGTSTMTSDFANYKVHPAFTFGSDELTGIWFGKFETGGTLRNACTNESCDVSNIVIKPNVKSLTSQTVSSFFYATRSMQMNTSNPYGFSSTTGNLHMTKNSEWGAVAYLSQSKFGKYGNSNYTSTNKEVAINNCNSHMTGIDGDTVNSPASNTTCTTNTYETKKGQSASTTGNITGVYDMSGGAGEYVMGVLADDSGVPRSGYNNSYNSGFNGSLSSGSYSTGVNFPEAKYYDLYTSEDVSTACNGGVCYGHALSGTAGWYQDYQDFINSDYPWFVRGGVWDNAMNAGIFYFNDAYGRAYDHYASRAVITR